MADPLLKRIGRILVDNDEWSSSWEAVEILSQEFGETHPKIWWCAKYESPDFGPVGKKSCGQTIVTKNFSVHRKSVHGCGWHFLYPDKEN